MYNPEKKIFFLFNGIDSMTEYSEVRRIMDRTLYRTYKSFTKLFENYFFLEYLRDVRFYGPLHKGTLLNGTVDISMFIPSK